MTNLDRWTEPDGSVVVRVVGDIDMATRDALISAVRNADVASADGAIIDLRDVAFMDSSGVGALVVISNHLGEGRLAVVVGPGLVDQVLAITSMNSLFHITNSLEDARRLLATNRG